MIGVKLSHQSNPKVKVSSDFCLDIDISGEFNLDVEVPSSPKFGVSISPQSQLGVKIGGEFYKVGDYEFFDGPYEVKPTFENQTLKTKNMAMKDDVEIKPISVTKVSNQSGGNTVIIGD